MTKHLCDSEFSWCPADARTDEFYKLRVKDLSPTQFAVGKSEVDVHGRCRRSTSSTWGVTKDDKGKVKLHQAKNLTALGAVSGGLWGTLIGLIFLNPLLGAAVCAGVFD